ncbi:MAG: PfkB family carbohydrate kinase [candidate division Zixibacteria bacterium]|nr:PfkB family carbohydrate kinase [candidate division Zixibacteria bacterium]
MPACNIGVKHYKPVISILKNLRGVDITCVRKVKDKNNHCHLVYFPNGEKNEILKGGVQRLRYDNIKPLLGCDIILVNYISGRDIYLKSLQKLRHYFKGKIYIDIHSLTLGKRKDGSRYLRKPPGWEKVVEIADYLQMNRAELSILTEKRRKLKTPGDNISLNLKQLYRSLTDYSIEVSKKVFIITDGANGCHWCLGGQRKPELNRISSPSLIKRGDVTGCGDCFSAGFIIALIMGKGLDECAASANQAAVNRLKRMTVYNRLFFKKKLTNSSAAIDC